MAQQGSEGKDFLSDAESLTGTRTQHLLKPCSASASLAFKRIDQQRGLTPFTLPSLNPLKLSRQLVVALVALVVIGGATRVMEAGLACPDWPLCYGSLLPSREMNLQVFLEWFHRLDAFFVGIGLIVLLVSSLINRASGPRWLPWLSGLALLLVATQGALGALTVTQLLRFDIVTAHLATALLLVALLSAIAQLLNPALPGPRPRGAGLLAVVAGVLGFGQCVAGALMATQWASGRCLRLAEGCAWLSAHRSLATPAASCCALLAILLLAFPCPIAARRLGVAAGALAACQVVLGVLTLKLALAEPLVTVAHQLLAALLVATLPAVALALRPNSPLELSHG
jgi:cytochrome c oxidase assembly protein subunit 15